MEEIARLLKERGVAATPIRLLVYKCLKESPGPLSLSEMEVKLDSVDKSTISRTLATFRENHLLHSFNDGSGSMKYELCKSQDHSLEEDTHVHFRCEKCGTTKCLPEIKIPAVSLPPGYLKHDSNYIITGICGDCSIGI